MVNNKNKDITKKEHIEGNPIKDPRCVLFGVKKKRYVQLVSLT